MTKKSTGVNIHLDTPTEILHTVLLGVVKYFWGQTIFLIEKAKLLDIFHSRLDSIERDALNAPSLNANYMCSYKGSLIGKHFKSLAQVMPFVIYDLVLQDVVDGWTTMGELVVLLWHTKITNLEVYLVGFVHLLIQILTLRMTGKAFSNDRRFLERDSKMCPEYYYLETEVSLSYPSTCLYS